MGELKIDKGYFGGSCNRTACQKDKSAFYFNHSTEKYYCTECANTINRMNPEAMEIYGHVLCTHGKNEKNLEVAPKPEVDDSIPTILPTGVVKNRIRNNHRQITVVKGMDDFITQPIVNEHKIGRNDICPICNSGLKYKKCCINK